jgi:superfamily II DNA or RNA helicase
MQLRDYQLDLVNRSEACIDNGGIPCLTAPTGAGKSVMISEMASRALDRGERVVAVAHRGEIVAQIVDSIRRHCGPVNIEVIKAGTTGHYRHPITVGMVPSMVRRLHHIEALKGCTLLADEAHHLCAGTWQKVVAALAPARMCGFTATPITPSGQGLGDTTQITELVIGPQIAELIAQGSLAPYKLFAAPRQMDTKGLRKIAGDFAKADMEQRVMAIEGEVVPTWRRLADGLPTLAIAVSVDHAHHVAAQYNEAGVPAAAVDGKTPAKVRERMFQDFRDGRLLVLASACVIEEGVDLPAATVLQQIRPTASLRLYRQLVGRVLRPSEGKEHAILLDHCGNYSRLPSPDADIDWQLNVPAREAGPPRTVRADNVTGEITLAPIEVLETNAELVEITHAQLMKKAPRDQRELLDRQARAQIERVLLGEEPQKTVLPLMGRVALLEAGTAARLGMALGFGANWGVAMWKRARAVVDTDRLNRLTRKTVKALT